MCNSCNEAHYVSPVPSCFELETVKCDKGCEDILSTDCIFHNIDNDTPSATLPFIGITKGASLNYILKKINEKLSESINTNFSLFNLNELDDEVEILNIRQFVEVITLKLKSMSVDISDVEDDLVQFGQELITLNTTINNNNIPGISHSELNINNTDSVKIILTKIIDFVEELNDVIIIPAKTLISSESITVGGNSTNSIAELRISQQPGNRIYVEQDGVFVADPSISNILSTINSIPSLKLAFNNLVLSTFPALHFDVMSSTNQIITYINTKGVEVTTTAQANTLVRLTDVKRIVSVPTTGLTITFKGIE